MAIARTKPHRGRTVRTFFDDKDAILVGADRERAVKVVERKLDRKGRVLLERVYYPIETLPKARS